MAKKEIIKAKLNPLAKWFTPEGTLKNAKHELYANAYVQELHFQKAAMAAGLVEPGDSAKDIAYRIASRPEVKQRIREVLKQRVEELCITEDWVIAHLAKVVERCMQIDEVTDREGNPTGIFEFDGRNANRALELIGNYLEMFKKTDASTAGKVVINLDYGGLAEKQVRITREPIEGEKA